MKRKIPLYNTSLKNLEHRLRAFRNNVPEMLKGIIMKYEETIVSAIWEDQLYKQGINGFGEQIMEYKPYRQSTIKRKKKKGQPFTRVTLHDKGNFYKQMYIVFEPDGFYITSRAKITPILIKKYGTSIFRLTDINLTRILKDYVRKEFAAQLKQQVNARK